MIKFKFPDVTTVDYIKTTDEGLETIVLSLGGTVTTAGYWATSHSYHDCMKLYGDNSPFVQGYLKATFPKDTSLPRSNNNLLTFYTTPSFFEKWDLGWYVTDETHLLGRNRVVYWGLEQIKSNCHLLPPLLHLRETGHHEYPWILIVKSAQFFTDDRFKIIEF